MDAAGDARPRVSIVIRSMGRPELREALSSLARQTHRPLDVVVVDATGGRHPPLPALPEALDVRVVAAGRPLRRAAAANVGLAAAGGELLGLLDDDDFLEPTHVARLVARAQAPDLPDLVYAGAVAARSLSSRRRRALSISTTRSWPIFPARSRSWLRCSIAAIGTGVAASTKCSTSTRTGISGCRCSVDARVRAVDARTQFYFQEAGTSGAGIGSNRGTSSFVFQQRVMARWAPQRTALWQARLSRFAPGIALQSAGRFAEAQLHCMRLLREFPGDPNVLFQLGQMVGVHGYLYAARNLIEEAARLNPAAGEYHITLARIEVALSNHAQAIDHFESGARFCHDQAAALRVEIERLGGRRAPQGIVAVSPQTPAAAAATLAPERVEAALAEATDAYRQGDVGIARARFGEVLALDPGHGAALHGLALAAWDAGDGAAAREALARMPATFAAQKDIADFGAAIVREERRSSEDGRALERLRDLRFLAGRGGAGGPGAGPGAPVHIVVPAVPALRALSPEAALVLAASLPDGREGCCWMADVAGAPDALPADWTELAPERGAFPRNGVVMFGGVPALPPTWLADCRAQRLVAIPCLDRPTDTLEFLELGHRATGLPVHLAWKTGAERDRWELPGTVIGEPMDCERLPVAAARAHASDPFVLGLVGSNQAREFHPDDPPLFRRLAGAGICTRVHGGTVLLRHFPPSRPDPRIALLPVDPGGVAAFLATIDAFLYWPGPRAREPAIRPAEFGDQLCAGREQAEGIPAMEPAAARVMDDDVLVVASGEVEPEIEVRVRRWSEEEPSVAARRNPDPIVGESITGQLRRVHRHRSRPLRDRREGPDDRGARAEVPEEVVLEIGRERVDQQRPVVLARVDVAVPDLVEHVPEPAFRAAKDVLVRGHRSIHVSRAGPPQATDPPSGGSERSERGGSFIQAGHGVGSAVDSPA